MTSSEQTTGTWAGTTPDGVVVARLREGELLLDRPSRRRFRETTPTPAVGEALVVGGVQLTPVAPFPKDLTERSTWYDARGRTVLLTQIPETYFGEPMILLAEGDRVVRAYPLDETRLLDERGSELELLDGGLRIDGEAFSRTTR